MKPKFGLEKEVFLLNTSNEPCIVPKKFPHDDEGFQVEFARAAGWRSERKRTTGEQ